MRKTNICILSILLVLALFSGFNVLFVKSQPASNIFSINADGTITPSTTTITRTGDIYTLTSNISGGLAVHKSNIIIDGTGFALNGNGGTGIDLRNNVTASPSPNEIWNVTIRNLAILNFNFSIQTNGGGNDTFYSDYIANSLSGLRGGIFLWGCSDNNITRCSIAATPPSFSIFVQAITT